MKFSEAMNSANQNREKKWRWTWSVDKRDNEWDDF